MDRKVDWFPIDTRIFPFDFFLSSPTSPLVKLGVFLELSLAVLAVVGTLFLIVLPPPTIPPQTTQATTK